MIIQKIIESNISSDQIYNRICKVYIEFVGFCVYSPLFVLNKDAITWIIELFEL